MTLETTQHKRKCNDCKGDIQSGEVVGISQAEDQYGTRKVSFCKVCTIKGLQIRKKRIEGYLKRIGGL
jgi:hypothetical protein